MSSADDQALISKALRVDQIMIGSMVAGLVIFGVIVILIAPGVGGGANPPAAPASPPVITYTAIVLGFPLLIASVLIPRAMTKTQRRNVALSLSRPPDPGRIPPPGSSVQPAPDAEKLLPIYHTQLIVGAAMCEGPTFLALIAYMVERQPLALALAGIFGLGVACRFPTRARVEQWIDAQLEQARLEQSFGG